MGHPLGPGPAAGDGLVVDYFLGTARMAAVAGALDAVQAAIDAGGTDPLTLRSLHPELVPFYCPDCALNYCAADWHTQVVLDRVLRLHRRYLPERAPAPGRRLTGLRAFCQAGGTGTSRHQPARRRDRQEEAASVEKAEVDQWLRGRSVAALRP
jgi:hypothetical protein